jgi:hypothetical protein
MLSEFVTAIVPKTATKMGCVTKTQKGILSILALGKSTLAVFATEKSQIQNADVNPLLPVFAIVKGIRKTNAVDVVAQVNFRTVSATRPVRILLNPRDGNYMTNRASAQECCALNVAMIQIRIVQIA